MGSSLCICYLKVWLIMEALVETLVDASDVKIGFHPEGYRIDTTASPIYRYTKWQVRPGNRWVDPKPVCFHSLPQKGWIHTDKFDWNAIDTDVE